MNSETAFEYFSRKRKFDSDKAVKLSRQGAIEGIVLLENKNFALPLKKGEAFAFFGRMQKHYLMLGTGSGGRVTPPYQTDIFSSLVNEGFIPDREVEAFYDDFVSQNPYDTGNGWSNPPSQKEPILSDDFIAFAAKRNKTAIFVLTRTAGEDKDAAEEKGSYFLSDTEKSTLEALRKHFSKLIVILNICSVIDLTEIKEINPDGVLLVWQGGAEGGTAAAQVLTGACCPSGRLPDTFPAKRKYCSAYKNVGQPGRNYYKEDIFVGYRRFFEKDKNKVLYPFGYGLSYTDFSVRSLSAKQYDEFFDLEISVTNIGSVEGKTSVLVWLEYPQTAFAKPFRVLCGFAKTENLNIGESQILKIRTLYADIAPYDDSGITGHRYCRILEKGNYGIYLGGTQFDCEKVFELNFDNDKIIRKYESALAPVLPFERLVYDGKEEKYEPVPLRIKAPERSAKSIAQTGDRGIKLCDVASGKASIDDFIAQLDNDALCCIVRGEGMSSPKVTPGTGAAFGGVTQDLKKFGIPIMCCTDGPSGVRMVSDAKCIAYPSATCQAASFNTKLIEDMYEQCGAELASYGVDMLLGPGVNIHRDPLCGRNFEYYSEDPVLAGQAAAACCRGLSRSGVSGVVKHFAANNQETDRHGADSVLSERAVRDIYARPFEIAVRDSDVCAVMTSYNPVNGLWAATNYDLTVRLLRDDFGFKGFVMTDWWAKLSDTDGKACVTNLAAMVHAQNDVYMVTPDAETREDNLKEALKENPLTLGELQCCAKHICEYAIKSLSFKAQQNGYGREDLSAIIKEKSPTEKKAVNDNSVILQSDKAKKVILQIKYISNTDSLTQTNVKIIINTKKAQGFIVGGTEGKELCTLVSVGLVQGENNMVFNPENDKVRITEVQCFDFN